MTPKLGTIEEERAACEKRWQGFGVGAVAHCCYHDQHFTVLADAPQVRIEELAMKPSEQQAILLHLFGPYMATVPDALRQAENSCQRTYAEYHQAQEDWFQVLEQAGAVYKQTAKICLNVWGSLWQVDPIRLLNSDAIKQALVKFEQTVNPAEAAYQKTKNSWEQATASFRRISEAWQASEEFIAEHNQLFPDCAWNGESIFPKAGDDYYDL